MNRIVLIGNGFDLAHQLKTSYKNFIDWYWDQRLHNIVIENGVISSDVLCSMKLLPSRGIYSWFSLSQQNGFF